MFKEIQIFDLDGTLVDSSHRTPIVNGSLDLAGYLARNTPENVLKDKPLPLARFYRECLNNPEIYTVICTVRCPLHDGDFQSIEKLGKPNRLISPKKNIGSKGHEFKRRALGYFKNLKQFKGLPVHFHEDNIKYLSTVCDAYGYIGHYYHSGQGAASVTNIPENMKNG